LLRKTILSEHVKFYMLSKSQRLTLWCISFTWRKRNTIYSLYRFL